MADNPDPDQDDQADVPEPEKDGDDSELADLYGAS